MSKAIVNSSDKLELVGQIIDIVEDFLDEKGVSFPETPDLMREAGCSEDEIAENNVVLYGENYDALADPIEATLKSWGIFGDSSEGESEDELGWHDLRKNADDLPKEEGFYLVVINGDIWGKPDAWDSSIAEWDPKSKTWGDGDETIIKWMPMPGVGEI